MSPVLLASSAIVVLASIAFIVVGTVYGWNLASRGYARWQQVVGVCAVLGLAVTAAYSRIGEPLIAAAIVVGGVALALAYVIVYRRLTARVRELLAPPDDSG
jgi:TRAP-type C4-dicarboxylate transport system permease small subunit